MSLIFEISKIQTWIREAGTIALNYYYQTDLNRERKDDFSLVTEADKAVEKFLIQKIEQTYDLRHVGIMAEESGGEWRGKEFVWAIDPVDGTRVFVNGLPLWCISMGLLRDGEPYRGVVYLPVLNELYYTDDTGVPFWNDRPLRGRLQSDWDRDSFIAISSEAHRYFDIDFRRLRALGAIATHHVYVARGVAVAALHRQANVWDIAGAHAILTAAGGTALYLDGSAFSMPEVLANGACRLPLLVGHPGVLEKLLLRIKSHH